MIGKIIGKWQILKALGRGGMAEVFLAEHLNVDHQPRKAAVKLMTQVETREDLARFHREVEILLSLSHPNIVELLETGEYEGQPYFVMEHVDGLSMDKVLEQRSKLHWEEVIEIGKVLAAALNHAHKHEVVHGDIKPGNVLASWSRDVKLVDFGVGRILDTKHNAKTRGTVDYTSPEQASGKPASRKADLYSLGVVLYELVTGRLPFIAETDEEMLQKHRAAKVDSPKKWIPDIPPELEELILSLLEKDPEKRPVNAKAVEETLIRLQKKAFRKKPDTIRDASAPTKLLKSHSDVSAHTYGTTNQPSSMSTLVQAIVLIAALIGLGFLWWWLKQPPSAEKLLQEAEVSLEQNYPSDAAAKLDRLQAAYGDQFAEQAKSLRDRILLAKESQSLKSTGLIYTPIKSEAERFYRQGVIQFHEGKTEKARELWKSLIAAYREIPEHAVWVKLAQEAIDSVSKTEMEQIRKQIQSAIQKSKKEGKEAGKARLVALKELYQTVAEQESMRAVWGELQKALADL